MQVLVPAVVVVIVIIAVTVIQLSGIYRAVEPKDETHDQTSNHQSSNNGGNIQVGGNHSLLFGFIDGSNCSILLTLYIRHEFMH